MKYLELIRGLLIALPAVIISNKLVHQKRPIRYWIAVLFSICWQIQLGIIVLACAVSYDEISFYSTDSMFLGVPIDIVFAMSLLIVYIQSSVKSKSTAILNVILFMLIIRIFTKAETPLITDVFLLICATAVTVPAHFLFKWTNEDRHIYLRSLLQNFNWALLLLWLFPSIIFSNTSASWAVLVKMNFADIYVFIPLVVPAYLITNALYHFARYGGGTGFPYDAPKVLVTTGVYQYISNPMQSGIVLMMLIWGMILNNPFIILSSLVAVCLFIVFAKTCNGTFQLCGQDPKWLKYQKETPKWVPIKLSKFANSHKCRYLERDRERNRSEGKPGLEQNASLSEENS